MRTMDRRTFLRQSALVAAGTVGVAAGPFRGLMMRAAMADPVFAENNGGYGPLGPVPDLRDGVVRLHLPADFQYRSFGLRGTQLTEEATPTPGRHDGMAAFSWRGGKLRLIRNHEQFDPSTTSGAFGDASKAYDPRGPGGTTTLEITPEADEVTSWVSLNGTNFNCAGGASPWGTWITCEESVNGPDANQSFLGPVSLQEKHGYLYEVPVSRDPGELEEAVPIRNSGRFPHEAAAVDPNTGIVYMTEDDFAYFSGFFRYVPPNDPFTDRRLKDGGKLQVLGVVRGKRIVNVDLHTGQTPGTKYRIAWIDIDEPDPDLTGLGNDPASRVVFQEGESKGAARFSRLEGMAYFNRKIFFVSTEGGGPFDSDPPPNSSAGVGDGYGQVWMYDIEEQTLTLLFESPGPDVMDFPDNITISPRHNSVLICEDTSTGRNMLLGLTTDGLPFEFAQNRVGAGLDEFAGATFSPGGEVLYANMQSNGITYAIFGPWERGLL